ncbi:MAG: hypothetical protein FWD57_06015 [Polyangiaceae bacterium]|nr:hypothetical protein [Polyangiaceae bacterium]
MSTKSVLEAIMDQVVERLGPGAVPHAFGAQERNERTVPPRVSWIAGNSSFLPGVGGGNPRKLWVERQTVEIHVWGRDNAEVRTLWTNELAALARFASTSVRPQNVIQAATDEQWLVSGSAAVLTIELDVPVFDLVVPTAPVESWSHEGGESSSDGGGGWIESETGEQ